MFPRVALLFCALAPWWAHAQPFGLEGRTGNSTLRLPPAAAGQFQYGVAHAFGPMSFDGPVGIVTPPGETNRIFIVEQTGKIIVLTNLAAPNKTVFLDLSDAVAHARRGPEEGLLGLAFHPGYATNRFFYTFYVTWTNRTNPQDPSSRHDRLSRFETSATNPNSAVRASELVLLQQFDEGPNHNGGDLHFGPDGYLYVSLGDEGDSYDGYQNSQRITKDFFSGILRLDVDKRPGNLAPNPHPSVIGSNYLVPRDNPFVGATHFNGEPIANPVQVRTEFWAVGLRNPWRFCFDAETGRLFCGDVGQNEREEVNLIVKGGNYGWNFREGLLAGIRTPPPGFVETPPLLEYAHGSATNQGASVTGGVFYRGSRLPELNGLYIFGDYVSGHLWSLRYEGSNTPPTWNYLTRDAEMAAFGTDPSNGDVLWVIPGSGLLRRLVRTGANPASYPATLAETGVFADLPSLRPAPGFVGFDVNAPLWSDGALKQRWLYVPTNRTITFSATNNWTFPTGTVWVKHFELELTNGVPASRRRLETRLLVRDNQSGVYGITYRWGASTSDATLVPDGGMDEPFVVSGGGLTRTQVWHYPSRGECLACHTSQQRGGLALGCNTPQLNRDFLYTNGVRDNQLRALHHAGYFDPGTPAPGLPSLMALNSLTNESASVEHRVRSYLAANCSFCHQPGGSANALFDARIFTTLPNTRLLRGDLLSSGGDINARVVVPGSLAQSMLWRRMTNTGAGRMPPVGSSVVDTQAVALVARWITEHLPTTQTFPEWQLARFGSTNAANASAAFDADADGAANYLEYLTGTNPNAFADVWRPQILRMANGAELIYPRVANRGFVVQYADSALIAGGWRDLDVPENRLFFAASNSIVHVQDLGAPATQRFYRVRVVEP